MSSDKYYGERAPRGFTCLSSICTIPLAILARETKRVRLLALGMPVANRLEPIRVAEEFAMIDVISRGRLEMGLIKVRLTRLLLSNSNPAMLMESIGKHTT